MRTPGVSRSVLALSVLVLGGCRGPGGMSAAPSVAGGVSTALAVDHVVLAVDSLERGMAFLRQATGVAPAPGGAHVGRGTRNALLGLGSGRYLELLAPAPDDTTAEARRNAAGRVAYFGQFRTPTPVGWALRVSDVVRERARLVALGLPAGMVQAGRRSRPDGRELQWAMFDPLGQERDVVPFLIAWSAGAPHPSDDAPGGCVLHELRVRSPAADSLRAVFARAGWPVAVDSASDEQLTITLACPTGIVSLP